MTPTTTPLSDRVSLAPVSSTDFDALADLRTAAMRDSLERVGRFDPARSRQRLRNSFHPEHSRHILFDGERIGFYTFQPTAEGFWLDHLYVHPDAQGQGVGSLVVRHLISLADAGHAPIHLGALRESDSNRFYTRHGFSETREDQWDIHYTLHARADTTARLSRPRVER
jgi:GNAT superfamily N-acetyltransferase